MESPFLKNGVSPSGPVGDSISSRVGDSDGFPKKASASSRWRLRLGPRRSPPGGSAGRLEGTLGTAVGRLRDPGFAYPALENYGL